MYMYLFVHNDTCTCFALFGIIVLGGDDMPRTPASNAAQYKYNRTNLKRVPLDVQKEEYNRIKAHADTRGESVNGFIKRAIKEQMQRDADNADTPPNL